LTHSPTQRPKASVLLKHSLFELIKPNLSTIEKGLPRNFTWGSSASNDSISSVSSDCIVTLPGWDRVTRLAPDLFVGVTGLSGSERMLATEMAHVLYSVCEEDGAPLLVRCNSIHLWYQTVCLSEVRKMSTHQRVALAYACLWITYKVLFRKDSDTVSHTHGYYKDTCDDLGFSASNGDLILAEKVVLNHFGPNLLVRPWSASAMASGTDESDCTVPASCTDCPAAVQKVLCSELYLTQGASDEYIHLTA
jgi:hypothetical protein